MTEDFPVAVIYQILKKNYETNCNRYREMSLLNTTYKIQVKTISKTLNPILK